MTKTKKRTYGAGSTRQKIIQYFRENPDASPAVVAKQFGYSTSATSTCKWEAKKEASTNHAPKPPGWVMDLVRPKGFTQDIMGQENPKAETQKEEAPADPWRAYGLWMTREQFAGYLRGLAVTKLTRPILGNKDLLEVNRIVTKLAEITGG